MSREAVVLAPRRVVRESVNVTQELPNNTGVLAGRWQRAMAVKYNSTPFPLGGWGEGGQLEL